MCHTIPGQYRSKRRCEMCKTSLLKHHLYEVPHGVIWTQFFAAEHLIGHGRGVMIF